MLVAQSLPAATALRQSPSTSAEGTPLLQTRLAMPPVPRDRIQRTWLERRMRRLIERHSVVVVSAMAGSGKTTMVATAARTLRWPVAWLTIERSDADPCRLLTYIEAALAARLPELNGAATLPLAAGIAPARAAAMLAEAVGAADVVLVLDQLDRLTDADPSWHVVEALLRHAPAGMRHVVVSRRTLQLPVLEVGASAELGDRDLAFTAAEAGEALAGRELDAEATVAETGGWLTGVILRADGGARGAADPTHEYLARFVLSELAPADRDFLVATSLLDEVDARSATALGQERAAERLRSLRTARLPVSWSVDRDALRCHACLRELLLELLARSAPDLQRALRLRHGRLLAAEGRDEEATDALLRAGALDEAAACAERVIVAIVERLDLALAERWLEALEGSSMRHAPSFVTAELMLALAHDDPGCGVRVGDRLRRRNRLQPLIDSCPTAAALLAWCHAASDRPAVFALAGDAPGIEAARLVAALSSDVFAGGMPSVPEPTGEPLDAVVSAACHLLGRLSAADIPSSPWHEAVTAPWRIATLRASGRTQRALEVHDVAVAAGATAVALEASVGPELLIDAGRPDAARAAIARGRRRASAGGNPIEAWRAELAQAKLALRVDGDPGAARAVLDRLASEIPATGLFRELLDTWYGLALLLERDDAAALTRLRGAVARMLAGDRILELPTAAVYLAEAEWRANDEDAADRAADIALDAARRQGSDHVLLQALADFPLVVSRRIDAEPRRDSRWSAVGRALIAQRATVRPPVHPSVRLQEFGPSAIFIHDEEVRPRIAKTYELLAYLLRRPGGEAHRHELLRALFDDRTDDSTRAYLRQAILGLRRLLPEDSEPLDDGRVRLPELVISGDSLDFESRLVEAARLQGTERLDATLAALEIYDRGEYLAGAISDWVIERRRTLHELATDARYEAARLAFSEQRHAVADQLTRRVLSDDPFRETAWRLAMRLARARGDHSGVARAYHACARALAQIGTSPTLTTRSLAEEPRPHGGSPPPRFACATRKHRARLVGDSPPEPEL